MGPSMTSSGSTPAWQVALAEVHSAEQLLAARSAALVEVAEHLREAWGHLFRELHPASSGQASIEPAALVELAERYYVPVFAGEELARRLVLAEPSSDEVATISAVPELAQGLACEAAVVRRAVGELSARRDGSAWVSLGLCATITVLLAFAPLIGDLGGTVVSPWRGLYYNNGKFEGEPKERFDRSVDFDFGKESPMRGIGVDDFSIRWDTCMLIDEEVKVRFQLSSDDGSRLLVDGESVVENWGDHGTETRGGSTTLGAGWHHLEVEYYEARHGANVTLGASFDTSKPSTIPVEMLAAPIAGDDPCP